MAALIPLDEAVRLDAELVRVGRGASAKRLAVGEALATLSAAGGYHELGFSSFEAYASERCERTARWADIPVLSGTRARVHEGELADLPAAREFSSLLVREFLPDLDGGVHARAAGVLRGLSARCFSVCESRLQAQRRDAAPPALSRVGGSDEDENVASLCVWCHLRGVHEGRIGAEPPASRIRWRIGRGGTLFVEGRTRLAETEHGLSK